MTRSIISIRVEMSLPNVNYGRRIRNRRKSAVVSGSWKNKVKKGN